MIDPIALVDIFEVTASFAAMAHLRFDQHDAREEQITGRKRSWNCPMLRAGSHFIFLLCSQIFVQPHSIGRKTLEFNWQSIIFFDFPDSRHQSLHWQVVHLSFSCWLKS